MNRKVVFKNLIIITFVCVFYCVDCFGQSLNVTYNTPNKFTVGTAIPSLSPTVTGGTATAFVISPSLSPTGLAFNTSTGIITGTPNKVSDGDYNISATNSTGSSKAFAIKITINQAVPSITYKSPNTFTLGKPINELDPSNSGGQATQYSINPLFTNGLTFNTLTGAIAGTPKVISAAEDYTVIAINEAGPGIPFKVNIAIKSACSSDSGCGIALLSLILIFLFCFAILGVLLFITIRSQKNAKEALGLPSGSVRAVIAILFIVFFMLLSVVFYFDCNPNSLNVDLSKQIITILGTLVTAVSAFYFGSKTSEQAHANAAAAFQQNAQLNTVGQQVKIALSLDPSVPAAVSTAAAGAALNNASVQIVQSGTTAVTKGTHLSTDPNGTFTFTGVLTGNYTLSGSLQVTPEGAIAPVTLNGTQVVSIQAGVASITLTIK